MNWFMLANELIQHSRNTSIATAVVLRMDALGFNEISLTEDHYCGGRGQY